jgi:hypothetical protein
MGKDHDRKGTGHGVLAEIQEVDSFLADFHSNYFPSDASRFAYVLCGFVNGDAVGGLGGAWGQQEEQERDQVSCSRQQYGSRCRALPGWTAGGGCPHMVVVPGRTDECVRPYTSLCVPCQHGEILGIATGLRL